MQGFREVRVAAISLKPQKWKKEENALKMERFFRIAAARGAKVALITEGALEGYVAEQAIRSPNLRKKMLEVSEKKEGDYIKRFSRLAKELKMCLAFGYAERQGDEVYNSAVFIDYDGVVRGAHRKTQLAEGYDKSWFFNRLGDQVRAFETPYGRAGFMICYERWNPTLARALVLDGAQVIYIPAFGSKRPRQDVAVLARARENGVPIIEANVGVNLIISKGEVVAKERGVDKVTVADIQIPSAPSTAGARELEAEFLAGRPKAMHEAYVEHMTVLKRRAASKLKGRASARPRRLGTSTRG